jgi:uncharacterized protein (DUF849 family)
VKKIIIEARINEYAGRDVNRNVPWTTAEIVADAAACREAGAAVVHFHARQDDGSPNHSYQGYAEAVSGIRRASDILIHPTLGFVTLDASAQERLAHIAQMHRDGIAPDFAPMDMGSTNVSVIGKDGRYVPEKEGLVYQNSTQTLHYFADKLREYKVKPVQTIWNIAHVRETAQFIGLGWLQQPVYALLTCTDNHCIGGHPGTPKGLQAFIDFLPADARIEWTVCNYGGNLLQIAGQAIAQGGHVAIGLGDWGYPELGQPTNADLVRRIADMAKAVGREVATPAEARQMLAID